MAQTPEDQPMQQQPAMLQGEQGEQGEQPVVADPLGQAVILLGQLEQHVKAVAAHLGEMVQWLNQSAMQPGGNQVPPQGTAEPQPGGNQMLPQGTAEPRRAQPNRSGRLYIRNLCSCLFPSKSLLYSP